MINEMLRGAFAGLLVLSSGAVSAQQSAAADSGEEGSGTVFRGALEAGVVFTDNTFYTDNRDDLQESTGLRVKPEISVARILPRMRLSAGADAELGIFDLPDDVDDYTDYRVILGADWLSAVRHGFKFGAMLREDHDPFGTDRTESATAALRDLDQWRETSGDARYRYGLPTDRYNIDFSVHAKSRTYTTNESVTQFLDYEETGTQLAAYYNLTPKTAVFAAVTGSRTVYETVAPGAFDRGATELRYGVGAVWNASAKTSGDVRVGYVDRRRRNSNDDDFTGVDWTATFSWSPRSYRNFDIETGRVTQESYLNTTEFINNQFFGAAWVEQWTQRLQTRLGGRYLASEYVGTSRRDHSARYSLNIEYRVLRNLQLLASATNVMVDSDVTAGEYDRFSGYVGARYSR